MGLRIGRSFADLMNFLEAVLVGLKEAKEDATQRKHAEAVESTLKELRALDDRQEKAKAELHTTSKSLKAKEKEARALSARLISYLESVYGKSGTELQRYSIPRRQHGGGRKSKKEEKQSV